jgi:O-antigen/teichoic acid export membrane protein
MFVKLKQLAGQSFIYTVGGALTSSLSFLLVPLYTRVLTPEDYGILGVVRPINTFLALLLSLGLQAALMRFYYDYQHEPEKLRAYIGTIGGFLLGGGVVFSVFLTAIGPWLFGFVVPETPFNPFILLAIWTAFAALAQIIPTTLFRARQQPGRFVMFTVANFALTTALIILFVVPLGQGALGSLKGQFLATLLMMIPAVLVAVRSSSVKLSKQYLVQSLAFSLPLVPHLLGNWVLNLSDRIVLDNLVTKEQVGLYTLAYQFGIVLNVVAVALNSAWVPFFYEHAKEREHDQMIGLFTTYQVLLMTALALPLALLSREIIEIMAVPAYWPAYHLVPLIVLGYFARFLYLFPANGLFYIKRTRLIPIFTLCAGALNITSNLWLVPHFGILAAALNTLIGFAALMVMVYIAGQHLFPIHYEYGRLAHIVILGLGLFAVGWWLSPAGLWHRILFKGILLVAFPLLLWLSGFLSPAERKRLGQLWTGLRQRRI